MRTGDTIDHDIDPFPAGAGSGPRSTSRTIPLADGAVAHDRRAEPDVRPHAFLPGSGVVKVCGLREPVHAAAAAAAGADLLGFIFAPARRQITVAVARRCIAAARASAGDRRVVAVGVFVDAAPHEMNAAADVAGLDLLQLHGDEPPAVLGRLNRPIIKALRPRPGTPLAEVDTLADRYRAVANAPIAFLVDGFAVDAAGGAGYRADWDLARVLAGRGPMILAGGLDPGNVVGAIVGVRPLGVDVSSGVETDGAKDVAKIAAFVASARRALEFNPPRWPEQRL